VNVSVDPHQQENLTEAFNSCLRIIAGADEDKIKQVFTEWTRHGMRHAFAAGWDKVETVERLDNAGKAIGLDDDFRTQAIADAVAHAEAGAAADNIVAAMERESLPASQTFAPSSVRAQFNCTNTNVIMATAYPPLKTIVDGYLYEGFTVLAGRQKLGKTWLAIDWAVAVAIGGVAMGTIRCEAGHVLYIDLENGPRRIKGRIETLFADPQNIPDLSRLDWATGAPQLGQGFVEGLERWRKYVSTPRLVVIDVLQRIKPAGTLARTAYENDYSAWAPLQQWAMESGIAVLGLHHTKKGGAEDPLEALSGSNGLSACADTTIVLDSDQNGKTLYVRGRDVQEKETAVVFAGGLWTVLGDASEVRRSDERAVILETLKDNAEPMTPAALAAALGKQSNNIRQLLFKMAKAGEVYKLKRSRYWLFPVDPRNTDNADNSDEDETEEGH
jgi:hypothetical protein